jgi:hypothetical protein
MTQPVSRRNALGMFSTTGLGALLASCSSGGEGTASAPMTEATVDETYLRGTQVTNAERVVEFVTIYPGWYSGRTVHIHCKVHLDTTTLLTTQLFFDDALTTEVYAAEPYSAVGRDVDNTSDSIVEDSLVLTVTAADDGYLGLITFGVDPA